MLRAHYKRVISLLWFFSVPLGILLVYFYFPPQYSAIDFDLLGFLLLTCFVAGTPMIINQTPLFLIQWVSLAVFLTFGLFIEIIFMQIAVFVLLFRLRVPKEQFYRYPLNSIMLFIVSLISGLVFYGLGGSHGANLIHEPHYLLLALGYSAVYFILNQLVLSFVSWLLYDKKRKMFDKDFVWEAVTTAITLPLGLILYILYQEVGVISIIFVGIPFASLFIILNLYQASDKVNKYLQKATEIGHEMAERLNVNEVLDLFIHKVTELVPSDFAYVLDVVDEKELHLLRRIEVETKEGVDIRPLRKNEGISGHVWETQKAVLYHSKKDWENIVKGYMPDSVQSIIGVPIVRNNKVIGVLLLGSLQKRSYEKAQLMIVDILSSYFAVAIENAKHHERTQKESERCALTKLYNYRYMEKQLKMEHEYLLSGQRKQLSVIILDIDHFKSVNDTYGHQSGNEILCMLAERLLKLVGNSGTVARFGGEEFVIILPDVDKKSALSIAEFVRQTIANRPFVLTKHIEAAQKEISVPITASIGVATAPEDADNALALIRHADRALYVGAKRNGRNKVAEYLK